MSEKYYNDSMRMDDIEKSCKDGEPTAVKEKYEMVNHPKHYHPGIYEAINVIEAWNLGFSLGSAVKYISRSGNGSLKPDASLDAKQKAIEDLEKAAWYVNREIERLKKNS